MRKRITVTPKIETDNINFRNKKACSSKVISDFEVVGAFLPAVSFRILKSILCIAMCIFNITHSHERGCSLFIGSRNYRFVSRAYRGGGLFFIV